MSDPFRTIEPALEAVGEVVDPADSLRALGKPLEDRMSRVEREMLEMQDELFRKHSEIVGAIGDWPAVNPDDEGAPEEWQDMEPAARERRLRVARAANLSKAKAPVGLQLSVAVHAAITKAKATTQKAPDVFNLAVVELTVPPTAYKRRLIKADGEEK